ncbi:alpha/beta hydrolase-fold protein [Acuticoccus mangrovi]|uniref:DUF3327 domain-containing protein n=1 Tax=Acuticoccus mangrovi TaxID=2796142 RepID=A0A934MJX5_9HYPH|nr:alpha/beta hydrolase-fold protein [Acuticoccus mangrovi]MBJ3778766.1 DUF3327 domain-containing protein [Acuticoccus mangrovi]
METAVAAAQTLAPDETVTQALDAGESVAVSPGAGPGDYVEGRLAVESGRVGLDLVGADGTHRRRLAADAVGTTVFRFVAEEPGLMLRASAAEPSVFGLDLVHRLPPSEQVAPPRHFLSARIAALAEALDAGGSSAAFWVDIEASGAPLVEPGPDGEAIVTFLARGARHNARILGAPSGDHEWMERLGTSDVWFKSFVVPRTTRLAYKIAVDIPELPLGPRARRVAILATAKADPLNPAREPADAPDAYNQESILILSEAPPQPGLATATPLGAPRGTLSPLHFASGILGNTREIVLYRPAGFDPAAPDSRLLILFDGEAYQTRVPTPQILDDLIAAERIPPTAAVFVPTIDRATRSRELPDNPDFADALATELMPLLTARLGAAIPPERVILGGSSFGGLAAATAALRHPAVFGNVLSLSGSFWWHDGTPDGLAARIAREPRKTVRFHLTAGLFERPHGDAAGILDTTRHLCDVLRAKGYRVSYGEYAGGHDYLIWRGALGDGLIALTGLLPR